ncbi:MAG: UvrD-helicase domain-containing protein [Clostridia bacterium]|nr:UvrD-helicase domain-containing protein [Clostridia bacterium]
MQWTQAQQAAIRARNDSVLVSAAAGSGKTAVLVERVLSMLREGGRIDRMLIVTFTRAAAGEMRDRLGRRLEDEGVENAHLRLQALRLNRAAICTLHVFCARVLREHFQEVGIDPLARIGDEEKLNTLRRRAQDQVLEDAYAEPDEDERALFSQFEDGQIVELMDRLYTFLKAQEEPFAWAEEQCRAENAGLAHWLPLLFSLARVKIEAAQELLDEMQAILNQPDGPARYAPTWEADSAFTKQLIREAENGSLSGGKVSFARLSTKKASAEESADAAARFKDLREQWKKRVAEARSLFPEDREKAEKELLHPLPALRALCGLVKKMDEAYFALKQDKNYLDYSDLEHLTLRALKNPQVCSAVAGGFDALFIDEYQDVSGIQEAIVRALHAGQKNTLFMVGDVKQSIYRFRLADPTLFLQKYRDYSPDEDAEERKILLQQNFRSDENVLLAVNEVFSHAMREEATEIEYGEDAMLRPGRGQPFGAPVEIHLISSADDEGDEDGELTQGYRYEAAFVAKRIKQLMRFASVREGEGERPLRFRDIALLVRYAHERAPYIARALQMEGIPVYSDADAQFYELPEVTDILSLLRVIDNPLQDLPLLAALRCPCFGFVEEELARIRLVDRTPGTPFFQAYLAAMEQDTALGRKAREAWERLARWRFCAMNRPVDQLIWQLMEESGLYMRAGAQEEGELRQANMRLLMEKAQGENGQEGLGAFLKDIGRLHAADDGKTAKTLGENEDVVRILTLHKSKGLEFPVVFLLEGARAFRKRDGGQLFMHAKYGLALQYIDSERRVTRETSAYKALRGIGEKEALAEESRLLYVGMTRARERLILVGSPRKLKNAMALWRRPATAAAAGSAGCMLDWVMESLGGFQEGEHIGKNGSVWRMSLEKAEELTVPAPARIAPPPLALTGRPSDQTIRRMTRVIEQRPPLKTSVTAIAKRLRQDSDDWESPADKRKLPEEAPKPAFLEEEKISAAQRGTVTHRVLGLIDYDLAREGRFEDALETLTERGVLSAEDRRLVRAEWLKSFFASPLGRRALSAQTVKREWGFNLKGEKGLMIQGVIDLCFLENGAWVLCDYKTDAAGREELLERYALQLHWYGRALSRITGIPVRETLIFGLRAGEAYRVEPEQGKES